GSGSGVCVTSGVASAPRSRSTRSVHEITGAEPADPTAEAGEETNGGRGGAGGCAGGSELAALPAMSGRGGAAPWIGAVSRVAAGTRSVVAWKSERAIPVIGIAAFFQTVCTR